MVDILLDERIIGEKEILRVFRNLYGISSWQGAIKYIRRHNLPIRRTQSGKPMFFRSELIMFEAKYHKNPS